MYLYKQVKKTGSHKGDTYLAIKEKFYVPKKGSCERTVERIGYLSEFVDKYDDPIDHFNQYADELTEKSKQENTKTIKIDVNEKLEKGTNDTRNVGYAVFKEIYRQLELDKFWNWKTRNRRMKYSPDQIFRLIVFSRALYPGSKRFTLNNKDAFFEPFDGFDLDDIYHSLDVFAENDGDLQKWIFDHSSKICGERCMDTAYFDCP